MTDQQSSEPDVVARDVAVDSTTAGIEPGVEQVSVKGRSLWNDAWVELRHNPIFWVAAVLIVFFMTMAIFPQLFTNTDPDYADLSRARESPSSAAWFGMDSQGYDVYARTIYGARASIMVGLGASVFVVIGGLIMGVISGFASGWLDSVLSRLGEIFIAIPLLLGGILLSTLR